MKWLEFLMGEMPTKESSPQPSSTPSSGLSEQMTTTPTTSPTQPTPANPPQQEALTTIQPVKSEAELKLEKMVEDLQKQNAALAARVSANGTPTTDNYQEAILSLTGWKGVINADNKN